MNARKYIAEDGDPSREGFILIAVLWILAALAGLVGAYVAYALTMAQSADFYLRRVRAEAAISGALELAIHDLTRIEPKQRPAQGVFDYDIGENRAQVRFASEALRLDINRASFESLTAFFAEVGGGRGFAEKYAQRIMAWREKPGGRGADMEDLSYRAAGLNYHPRHGPFQSVEELWDVLELPPDFVARIVPLVTVYGGRDKWSPEDDDRKGGSTAQGAAGQPPSGLPQAQNVAAPLGGGGQQAPGGLAGEEQTMKPTRFEIRVIDRQGRVDAAEVVAIATRDGDGPYNVLLWRTGDELAAPHDGRRR